nr:hypothetical protein [Tanacetum cinerariifolium]
MSDSKDSTVTYTEAPPSPDYVPGLEEPEQAPPFPDFVLESVYLEFMPPEDEEDPTSYPADIGDNNDDDDRSSNDDEEDDVDVKEDEEHPALADSVPSPVHRVTAVMSILSPPPQILSPPPHILSPPLPISPPPLHASPTYLLGYQAAMIRLRADAPSTSHPLPSSLRFEVGESSSAPTARITGGFKAYYGFVGTLDDEIRGNPERETDETELGGRMTDFVTTVRQDTDEIYGRLDDAQDDRLLMSGQLNMVRRDRRPHARTARLMRNEARLSREALTQMSALQRRRGPARGPAHPKAPEEASSSS